MKIDDLNYLLIGSGFSKTDFGYWYALEDERNRVVICVGKNEGIYKGRWLLYNRITTQYKSYENELWKFGQLSGLAKRFLIDCVVEDLPRADDSTVEHDKKYRIVWEKGRSEFERPYFLSDLVRTFINPLKNNDMKEEARNKTTN